MRLAAAITLYGYGTSEGVKKEWDTRGRGRNASKESEGFFSPNIEEGMNFQQAYQQINSPQTQQAVSEATKLEQQLFGGGSATPAVGEWKDGAEPSVVMHVPPGSDKDTLEYAMATLGKEFNQKQVLAFSHDTMGKDAMWTMHTSDDMDHVRQALDSEKVEFRTLIPEQGGTTVHIFDQGMGMVKNIQRLATVLQNTQLEVASGGGEFIGGNTREEGQAAYSNIITNYQRSHGSGSKSN